MKKKLFIQKLLICLNWVLLSLLYTPQMNTSPRFLCGKEKWQISHDWHIEKHHFKMDTLWSAVRLKTPNCFMAWAHLNDVYYMYIVPIAEGHRKYLRFYCHGCLYQYPCMPNGLPSAPTCFTKFLKPVYSTLRQYGHLNVGYIDD